MSVLTALERPRWAVAGTDARYPRGLTELVESTPPVIRRRLDGRCQLIFAVPATQEMRTLLTARRVVLAAPPGEPENEWIISRTAEIAGPEGRASLAVECDSIRVIMGDVGVIERTTAGGNVVANLGGVNGRPVNYLATFVIPELVKKGVGWIELGTIDAGVQFDLTFDAATPLAVTQQVATEAGLEWMLRPDEPNDRYLLDMVRTVGGAVETVVAKEGHNILSLARQRNREKLFTAIRPVGLLPTGSDDRANIGYATWRVTGVTGDVIEVEAHNGGDGPILEDGQHVGRYLEAADGTFWEIEDSDLGDQSFTLETGGGASFAVLDDVMIVHTDTGELMTDLVSPSGVAGFGYVQGVSQGRDLGHRNWLRNPALSNYVDATVVQLARIRTASFNSTTVQLKELPVGFQIFTGDRIRGVAGTVTADVTADGSGNVNVVMTISQSTDLNAQVLIYRMSTNALAVWTQIAGPAYAVPSGPTVNLTATVAGVAFPGARALAVSGLPANQVIPAGTIVTTPGFIRYVVRTTTADGSGNATVITNVGGTITAGTYTFSRPAVPGSSSWVGGEFNLGTNFQQNITIRNVGGAKTWFTANFQVWSSLTGNIWFTGSGQYPVIEIYNADGSSLLHESDAIALDYPVAFERFVQSITIGVDLADGEYRIRIRPPLGQITHFWSLLSTQAAFGVESPPFVDGSAATRLFQEGNLALLASRQWPATYTARVAEIESAWGLPADSPALSVGNFIRLRSPSLDEDTLLRITQIEFNPLDPSDKILTLDADPERITQIAARARPRAVFVNVDVTVDQDGRARETVLVSDTPPALVVGVERFVVPSGTEAPTTPIALAVAPITQFDLGG